MLGRDASNYAVGAVLDTSPVRWNASPVAFWSQVLAEGQLWTWTAREKETYTILCALQKWSGQAELQPVVLCIGHQSVHNWQKEHVDTPFGPAARQA